VLDGLGSSEKKKESTEEKDTPAGGGKSQMRKTDNRECLGLYVGQIKGRDIPGGQIGKKDSKGREPHSGGREVGVKKARECLSKRK